MLAIAHAVQTFTVPKAQRSMHGAWTYFATGSHVPPRCCYSSDSATFATTRGFASYAAAIIAAAIADATPISAWQPPSAADSVALCLHRYTPAAAARTP